MTALLGPDAALLLAGVAGSALVAGLLAGAFGIGGGAIIVPVLYAIFFQVKTRETVASSPQLKDTVVTNAAPAE